MVYTTKIEQQTKVLFYIALSLTLLGQLYIQSTWPNNESLGKCVVGFGLVLVLIRFFAVLYSMPIKKTIIILLICPFILYTCTKVDLPGFLLYPFLFSVSAWNVRFRNIVKLFFIINLCFLILTVPSSVLGVIPNKIFTREEFDLVEAVNTQNIRIRYSFGYNYPTNFAAYITYINMMWWYIRKGILRPIDYVSLSLSIWFVNHYCNARTEVVIMTLIVLASLYYRMRVVKAIRLSWIEKKFLILSIPLLAALMLFLEYQYMYSTNEIYQYINIAFSGRLDLVAKAISTKGIPWFGQFYVQRGMGTKLEYNYIDCQYMIWLIIYGIFTFVLALYVFYFICRKSVHSEEYLIAIILSILAIQNLIFPSLGLIKYNPFFMALFANVYSYSEEKLKAKLVYVKIN